jgi:Tol biopolymer transport system component
LTFQRGAVSAARFGPGGEVLYSASWEGKPWGLFGARLGTPDPRRLPPPGVRLVGVSPHGEVAFLDGSPGPRAMLSRASIAGGPAKDVTQGVMSVDWSPDGSEFAVARGLPGKSKAQLEWPLGRRLGEASNASHLRIAPDGRRLGMLEHPVVGDDRGWVLLFERDGRSRRLSQEWGSIDGLAWSPRGDEIWFTASNGDADFGAYAVSLDGRQRLLLPGSGRLVLHDVDARGAALVELSTQRQEVAYARAGEPERSLSWLDMTSVVELTRDGQRLLLNETGAGGGPDYGVYLRAADGSPPVRLGSGRATALSPDGQYALSIPIRERNRLELLPTGTGQPRTLTDAGIVAYEWAFFFPDGQHILFVGQDAKGAVRLYVRGLEGGGPPRPIAPENVRAQKLSPISPDGKQVAARCGQSDYCLYPVEGGEPQRIPGMEGVRPVFWDRSGRYLYVRDRAFEPPVRVYRLELATGRREPWRTLQPADPVGVYFITGIAAAPDASAYAYDFMRRLSELYVVENLG